MTDVIEMKVESRKKMTRAHRFDALDLCRVDANYTRRSLMSALIGNAR